MLEIMRKFHIIILTALLLVGGTTGRLGAANRPFALREKTAALSNAIKDLTITFDSRYPNGPKYLAKIDNIESRMNKASRGDCSAGTRANEIAGLTGL